MRKKILIALFMMNNLAFAETPKIMNDLVSLRSEIEILSNELEASQKEKQAELDMWMQKRLEIESNLQKEKMRHVQIAERDLRHSALTKAHEKIEPQGKSQLLDGIREAKNWVDTSLPFSKEQRKARLESLESRLERGMESPEILGAELWAFYESEIKLGTQNEFRIIDFDFPRGREKVEAVRLGLYTMFIRQVDGEMKEVVRGESGWATKSLSKKQEQEVVRLMEDLKQKRKSGVYFLPLSERSGAL
ncbi:MAG: DUF3450 family protein [Bdellovibrionales bacterium]|nr:DUF3450 family protein [Bdellovibrionales bacterium]